jgi:hypothetical protein
MKPSQISSLLAAAMLTLANAPLVNAEPVFALDAEIFHDCNLTRA